MTPLVDLSRVDALDSCTGCNRPVGRRHLTHIPQLQAALCRWCWEHYEAEAMEEDHDGEE